MSNENNRWRTRWVELAQHWDRRMANAGLGDVTHAIGEAARPLRPLALQFLWFAQPIFGLLGGAEAVGALIELFDTPEDFRQTTDVTNRPGGR